MYKTNEDFIKKAQKIHTNKFNYSETMYINCYTKVKIFCNKCKKYFFQLPSKHLSGQGCPYCHGLYKTNEDIIKEFKNIHGNNYDYTKFNYEGNHNKSIIICNKCKKEFLQNAHKHLNGRGCPYCQKSRGEEKIKLLLSNYNIKYIFQKRFKDCRDKLPLPFDFYLQDYNICIEYQGQQHYKIDFHLNKIKSKEKAKRLFNIQQLHDQIKRDYCKANNITLIEIKYNEDIEEKLSNLLLLKK